MRVTQTFVKSDLSFVSPKGPGFTIYFFFLHKVITSAITHLYQLRDKRTPKPQVNRPDRNISACSCVNSPEASGRNAVRSTFFLFKKGNFFFQIQYEIFFEKKENQKLQKKNLCKRIRMTIINWQQIHTENHVKGIKYIKDACILNLYGYWKESFHFLQVFILQFMG